MGSAEDEVGPVGMDQILQVLCYAKKLRCGIMLRLQTFEQIEHDPVCISERRFWLQEGWLRQGAQRRGNKSELSQ